MSWSISFIGKPEKVAEALEAYSTKLDGYSKEEYDKALPNMVALVKQNFGNDQYELLQVSASGSGYISDGVPQNSRCLVTIESIYGALV